MQTATLRTTIHPLRSKFLAIALSGLMLVMSVACNTSWISQATSIIAVLEPAAVNIITLVAALQGHTVSAADLNTITAATNEANADFKLIGDLLAQYNSANAASTIDKINVALNDAKTHLSGILTALHISDPATIAKISAVIGVVIAEIQSLAALIPVVKGQTTMKAAHVPYPLDAHQFKAAFNAVMTAPTPNLAVNQAAAGATIH